MVEIHPIIMCGGSGTRLWPASRSASPKQFLEFADAQPLVVHTAKRFVNAECAEVTFAPIVAICNLEQRFALQRRLNLAGLGEQCLKSIICEPSQRNTAAVAALAALYAKSSNPDSSDKNFDPLILLAPADHLITNLASFHRALEIAAPAALGGRIVTFGAIPTHPDTGYGYIRAESAEDESESVLAVEEFIEKPDLSFAHQLVDSGKCVWNCGIFLAKASTIIEQMQQHCPAVLSGVKVALEHTTSDGAFELLEREVWDKVENISFDYAVMEPTDRASVIKVDCGWSDIGTWNSLYQVRDKDAEGNAVDGDALIVDSQRCYVANFGGPALVVSGVSDIVAISTADAVLVADRENPSAVRSVVEQLNSLNPELAHLPSRVERPWGTYEVLDRGNGYQVKRLEVFPHQTLSLQYHHHRSEHWEVAAGVAEVTVGKQVKTLQVGDSIDIPLGEVHRLANPGDQTLTVIEVQHGDILEESDIVRIEDNYRRV